MKEVKRLLAMSLAMLSIAGMTGCGKQEETEPQETTPQIEVKSEILGGTNTGYEEEVEMAETVLKQGIVSYYSQDMELFVRSTDVDVLFTMMYGETPNETELIASLKHRIAIPIYNQYNKQKIEGYELQEAPNDRIIDEETGEIVALDWLSELKFDKPKEVTVKTTDTKTISPEHPIWILFQGKYYDATTEWAYRKKKTVMPFNPEEKYEVDKAYEISYVLGEHDEETDTDIETIHTGYAIHINGEWKYEVAVELSDKVFQQYLKETGLDENGNVMDDSSDGEVTEDGNDEVTDAETPDGAMTKAQ